MKILITGHRGFIGSHFWRYFEALGHELTGVDIADPDNPVDVRVGYQRWTRDHYDVSIHCAANVGGRARIDNEQWWVSDNFTIDRAFLDWARHGHAGKVVLFSSSAAYPRHLQDWLVSKILAEDDINLDESFQPDASYGWSKLVLERMAGWAAVDALILRPFSGYSHTQSEDYPFSAILGRVKRREDPLTIWSDTVRDFIHVDDIVWATTALLDAEQTGPFNLCTGVGTSFSELAQTAAHLAGYTPEIKVLGQNPGVQYRVGDPTKLHEFYGGVVPCITIGQGIQRGLNS